MNVFGETNTNNVKSYTTRDIDTININKMDIVEKGNNTENINYDTCCDTWCDTTTTLPRIIRENKNTSFFIFLVLLIGSCVIVSITIGIVYAK